MTTETGALATGFIPVGGKEVLRRDYPTGNLLKWAYDLTDSEMVEVAPLTPYMHAYVDEAGMYAQPYNRLLTSIAVAVGLQPSPIHGHGVVTSSDVPGGESRALTANEMALLDAAAERPVAVGALVLDTCMLAVAEADWTTVEAKGPLPRILPCKPEEVRSAGVEIQRLRIAIAESASISAGRYAGVAAGVRLSVRIRALDELDREMFEGWLWSHYEGELSNEDERQVVENAVTFFKATQSDLSEWFTLTRHIDLDDVPLAEAFSLAAGGLPVAEIPRFARIGISNADDARQAIADGIPDDYLKAMMVG